MNHGSFDYTILPRARPTDDRRDEQTNGGEVRTDVRSHVRRHIRFVSPPTQSIDSFRNERTRNALNAWRRAGSVRRTYVRTSERASETSVGPSRYARIDRGADPSAARDRPTVGRSVGTTLVQ